MKIEYNLESMTTISKRSKRMSSDLDDILSSYKTTITDLDPLIACQNTIAGELSGIEKSLLAIFEDSNFLSNKLANAIRHYQNIEKTLSQNLTLLPTDILTCEMQYHAKRHILSQKNNRTNIVCDISHLHNTIADVKVTASLCNNSIPYSYETESEESKLEKVNIIANRIKNVLSDSYWEDCYIIDSNTQKFVLIKNLYTILGLESDDVTIDSENNIVTKYSIDWNTGDIYYDGIDTNVSISKGSALKLKSRYKKLPEDFVPSTGLADGKLISYNINYVVDSGYTNRSLDYIDLPTKVILEKRKTTRQLYKHTFDSIDLILYELPDEPGAFSYYAVDALNGKRTGIIDRRKMIEIDDGNGGTINYYSTLNTLQEVKYMDDDVASEKLWEWTKAGISAVSDVISIAGGIFMIKTTANIFKIAKSSGEVLDITMICPKFVKLSDATGNILKIYDDKMIINGVETIITRSNGYQKLKTTGDILGKTSKNLTHEAYRVKNNPFNLEETLSLVQDLLPVIGTIRAIQNAWNYSGDYILYDFETGDNIQKSNNEIN